MNFIQWIYILISVDRLISDTILSWLLLLNPLLHVILNMDAERDSKWFFFCVYVSLHLRPVRLNCFFFIVY